MKLKTTLTLAVAGFLLAASFSPQALSKNHIEARFVRAPGSLQALVDEAARRTIEKFADKKLEEKISRSP